MLVQSLTAYWIPNGLEAVFASAPIGRAGCLTSFALNVSGLRKKNAHASCWHVDLNTDIRSLMSVEPNTWWFSTAHHELGHAYYFINYAQPDVPPLLRIGANPAFHEAMGELISLASSQVPYLQFARVLPADFKPDQTAFLLNDALANSVPLIF
jgi:peptidyl-dipeptidase A